MSGAGLGVFAALVGVLAGLLVGFAVGRVRRAATAGRLTQSITVDPSGGMTGTDRGNERPVADPLTEVHSREFFDRVLPGKLALARRLQFPVAVMVVGIDDLTAINRQFGRTAANEALQFVAIFLQSSLRGSDVVSRLAEGEFGVILPSTDGDQAVYLAQRLLGSLVAARERGEAVIPGRQLSISVGVGVYPGDGREDAAPVKAAVTRCRQALARGGNRVHGPSS